MQILLDQRKLGQPGRPILVLKKQDRPYPGGDLVVDLLGGRLTTERVRLEGVVVPDLGEHGLHDLVEAGLLLLLQEGHDRLDLGRIEVRGELIVVPVLLHQHASHGSDLVGPAVTIGDGASRVREALHILTIRTEDDAPQQVEAHAFGDGQTISHLQDQVNFSHDGFPPKRWLIRTRTRKHYTIKTAFCQGFGAKIS